MTIYYHQVITSYLVCHCYHKEIVVGLICLDMIFYTYKLNFYVKLLYYEFKMYAISSVVTDYNDKLILYSLFILV